MRQVPPSSRALQGRGGGSGVNDKKILTHVSERQDHMICYISLLCDHMLT
jgi:hypothetical protein